MLRYIICSSIFTRVKIIKTPMALIINAVRNIILCERCHRKAPNSSAGIITPSLIE